jgi:hypothetical protein
MLFFGFVGTQPDFAGVPVEFGDVLLVFAGVPASLK